MHGFLEKKILKLKISLFVDLSFPIRLGEGGNFEIQKR